MENFKQWIGNKRANVEEFIIFRCDISTYYHFFGTIKQFKIKVSNYEKYSNLKCCNGTFSI